MMSRRQKTTQEYYPKKLVAQEKGGITHSQASYPTFTSVLLTLQVATSGWYDNQ
jgi:hypothetical protein